MLEDNFVVSLLVLLTFFLQCLAQTHQLRSIPISYDIFQQFIIHHTELVLPNAEHNPGTMNIRSDIDVEACPSIPMIFCAWNYRSGPIFRPRSQCDVKTPSDSVFEVAVHKQRNTVQHLSASTRTDPISLLLNLSHDFEVFQNGLLSHSQ